MIWWPIFIATVAMVFTDVLGTIMVMAEARNRGWLAGWCDTAQWLVGITTTAITVTILQGHSFMEKVLIILFVSAANLFGTKMGQVVGTKYVKDAHSLTIKDLDRRMGIMEHTVQDTSHN